LRSTGLEAAADTLEELATLAPDPDDEDADTSEEARVDP
jgi:hypothetical protein